MGGGGGGGGLITLIHKKLEKLINLMESVKYTQLYFEMNCAQVSFKTNIKPTSHVARIFKFNMYWCNSRILSRFDNNLQKRDFRGVLPNYYNIT